MSRDDQMIDNYKTYIKYKIWNETKDEDYSKRIKEYEDRFYEKSKPLVFNTNDPDSEIIKANKEFAKSCFRLTKYSGVQDVQNLSVFEYHSMIEDVKKENESIRKSK